MNIKKSQGSKYDHNISLSLTHVTGYLKFITGSLLIRDVTDAMTIYPKTSKAIHSLLHLFSGIVSLELQLPQTECNDELIKDLSTTNTCMLQNLRDLDLKILITDASTTIRDTYWNFISKSILQKCSNIRTLNIRLPHKSIIEPIDLQFLSTNRPIDVTILLGVFANNSLNMVDIGDASCINI